MAQDVQPKKAQTKTHIGEPVAVVPATATFVASTSHTFTPKASRAQESEQPPFVATIPQAPAGVITGERHAWAKLALGTLGRAGLIGVGCYIAGIRDKKQLVLGSLAASATLSTLLTVHHAYAQRRNW